MNRKSEILLKRVKKAGIRASLKQGHALTESELRNIKIQIISNPTRTIFCLVGAISAGASYHCFTNNLNSYGIALMIVSIVTLLFGIFGMRRTLSKALDSIDVVDAGEILGLAAKGVASAIGSLFDGI